MSGCSGWRVRRLSLASFATTTVIGMLLHLSLLQHAVPRGLLRGAGSPPPSLIFETLSSAGQDTAAAEAKAREEEERRRATRLLDWTVYSRYPLLFPAFILPGPADLPLATTEYLANRTAEAEARAERFDQARAAKASHTALLRDPPLWADTDEQATQLRSRLKDIGCAESQLGRPNQACQLRIDPDQGYDKALRICREHPFCTHVIYASGLNRKKERWVTLKRLVSEKALEEEKDEARRRGKQTMDQCLALGREVRQMPAEEGRIAAHDEERAKTSLRTKERQSTLLFAHIQKAAGSTLCQVMKEDRFSVPVLPPGDRNFMRRETTGIMGKNCNPLFSDTIPAWYGTAATQVAYATEHGLTMYANEKFLGRDLPFGSFAFITSLRNPLDRLVSHFHGFGPLVKDFVHRRFRTVDSLPTYLRESEPNFMTRRLCAFPPRRYYNASLSEEDTRPPPMPSPGAGPSDFVEAEFADLRPEVHLECAKDRLRRFNLVLTSELLGKAGPRLLKSELGVDAPSLLRSSSSRTESSFESEVGDNLTYESLVELRARHAMDLELYAYGTALTCRRLAIEEEWEAAAREPERLVVRPEPAAEGTEVGMEASVVSTER